MTKHKNVMFFILCALFSFILPGQSFSSVDGHGNDIIVDAPWRTVRNYLPVMYFFPDFKMRSPKVKSFKLYNLDVVSKTTKLIFEDSKQINKDTFNCNIDFIDPYGKKRSHLSKNDKIDRDWHYIARVPTSCIGINNQRGKPGVHYLKGFVIYTEMYMNPSTNKLEIKEKTAFRALRVVVSENNFAKFSPIDHQYDVHVHTIAEKTSWHGMTNVDAAKKAFGGPIAMLLDSAYSLGLVNTQLKDANWSAFKNKIITTDHNFTFSGNPYDSGLEPNHGPTQHTNGEAEEFDWYRENFGVLGGEEITLKRSGSYGSHYLSYGAPHIDGPWHGGKLKIKGVSSDAPNNISLAHAMQVMGDNNGFGYASHPESSSFIWSNEFYERAIGIGDFRPKNSNDMVVQKNKNDFVFKGLQIWNEHTDMKSKVTGDIDIDQRLTFDPFSKPESKEYFVFPSPGKDWRKGHKKTYRKYKELVKRGLNYSFMDANDYIFTRKLYVSAGTDAHGDFNYNLTIDATAEDEISSILFSPNILYANNNAFGRLRTYTLTSQRYIKAGDSIPPNCSGFPFCNTIPEAPGYYPLEDYKEGNTVVTDGPVGRFFADANCRFNSDKKKLIWHDRTCSWENHDGMIGGRGKFDGGNTLLAPVNREGVMIDAQWIGQNDYLPNFEEAKRPMKLSFEEIRDAISLPPSGALPAKGAFIAGRARGLNIKNLNDVIPKSNSTLLNNSALIMQGILGKNYVDTQFITNPIWISSYRITISKPQTCPIKAGELKVTVEFAKSMDSTLAQSTTDSRITGFPANTNAIQLSALNPVLSNNLAIDDSNLPYKGIQIYIKPLNSLGASGAEKYKISGNNTSNWDLIRVTGTESSRKIQDAKYVTKNNETIPCAGSWDTESHTRNPKKSSYAVIIDDIYDMHMNYHHSIGEAFTLEKPRSGLHVLDNPVINNINAPSVNAPAITGSTSPVIATVGFTMLSGSVNNSNNQNSGYKDTRHIKGRCLDVAGSRNADKTNIQIYQCNGSNAQKWKLSSKGEIRNQMGRCLDVAGGINKDRTNVQLYSCNGTASQKWQWISKARIKNAMGRCLDIAGGVNANGTNVQIFTCKNTGAQQWVK